MVIAKVELECEFCHEIFTRLKAEHTRNQKYGRRIFCSLSCSAKQHNLDNPRPGDVKNFKGIQGVPLDEYSPFRKYLNSARRRPKDVDITLQDLKAQWNSQKGICPFTGWKLELPHSSQGFKDSSPMKYRASIDRIDSSKGYVKNNIQFITQMANLAKNNFTEEEVIEFCKAVSDYR